MKKLVLFLLPMIIFSCKNAEPSTIDEQIANFDWLTGDWKRLNEKDDRETFETWSKTSNSEYNGMSYTLQNRDTIWKEYIKLFESGNEWNFEVTGTGEAASTIFKVTNLEKEKFTSENHENDFPKLIHYFKNGLNLKAVISDGDIEIPFEFERIKR